MRLPARALAWAAWGAAATLCVGGARVAQYLHTPRGRGEYRFEIPRGAGPAAVARILAREGLGSWEWATRWGLRRWARPAAVKAGRYAFSAPVRLVDVFADLEAGRVEQVSVTIPEGLSLAEIGAELEAGEVVAADAFEALVRDPGSVSRWGVPGPSLEGYLFPDTYRFARDLPADAVVDAMVGRFREVTEPLAAEAASRGFDLRRWVTLASIVEKETGQESERPVVAAVFLNRLERGMRLESDPTVIYGIPDFDGDLRRADLSRDTPYNTYTRRGLPPGPIASPGRESLVAVLRPARVPYLYFVSRNDGTHAFAETLAEHSRNVDRYQRRRR